MHSALFGKLSLHAIPFNVPIILWTFVGTAILAVAVLGAITYMGKWGYLWREWLTSIDHKKIGIMYLVLALIMFLRGFADAVLMRLQQVMAFGANHGFLPPMVYTENKTA